MEPLTAANVKVEEGKHGGIKVFVSDEATDTFAVFRISRKFGTVEANMTLRGNLDARERAYGTGQHVTDHPRPAQHASLTIPAPEVSREELNRRREAVGLNPIIEYENVAVMFREFDSPAEAAAAAVCLGGRFTYEADKALKLTVGDRVIVPAGNRHTNYGNREATVVALNARCPVDYIKRVTGRA